MVSEIPSYAIILVAGVGSRLRPLTEVRPKPLIEVVGISILRNALRNLAALGVAETTVVVGYRKDDIIASCGDTFGKMNISYVESSHFDHTGSVHSLWLARETLVKGDIFLLGGDVFFESSVFTRMLDHQGDVAAIDIFNETMTGSAVILSEGGYLREFRMNQGSVDLSTEPLYKSINLFRFGKSTLTENLVPRLDAHFASGGRTAYVEEVLAWLIADGELRIKGALCDGLRWSEIDSAIDLDTANGFSEASDESPDLRAANCRRLRMKTDFRSGRTPQVEIVDPESPFDDSATY
ncbi:phosphocholine cytidylyltransferase family protein [Bradyrhizobium sp. CCGUVB1N3]|uniref:phosphocholine cytidylyltransferase family protein n=1 Tax=Bradyrhizobium sp. CCGUVB1N3 TaxID=2949629 RepID=UPI0020B2785E|nr:phosphocholine cytidylyltransferase family protein [Bradyrhizobium sp. CCGUVB1N3]MCP3476659.1 phosphocholine cytidylyltransferase family protein [Bradyrhizobium sp. CCGUVB1N3]